MRILNTWTHVAALIEVKDAAFGDVYTNAAWPVSTSVLLQASVL